MNHAHAPVTVTRETVAAVLLSANLTVWLAVLPLSILAAV
jgi:hypothetical protein